MVSDSKVVKTEQWESPGNKAKIQGNMVPDFKVVDTEQLESRENPNITKRGYDDFEVVLREDPPLDDFAYVLYLREDSPLECSILFHDPLNKGCRACTDKIYSSSYGKVRMQQPYEGRMDPATNDKNGLDQSSEGLIDTTTTMALLYRNVTNTILFKVLSRIFQMCCVYLVILDIVTDIIFIVHFHRAFPYWEKPVAQSVLIFSLIAPEIVFGAIYQGFFVYESKKILKKMKLPERVFLLIFSTVYALICSVLFDFFESIGGYNVGHSLYLRYFHIPAYDVRAVNGLVHGVLEDLPFLSVQIWIFVSMENIPGQDEITKMTLAFAFGTTCLNILVQLYYLYQQRKIYSSDSEVSADEETDEEESEETDGEEKEEKEELEPGGIGLFQYLKYLFHVIPRDKGLAKEYIRLLREGKFDDGVKELSLAYGTVGDKVCMKLVAAMRYNYDTFGLLDLNESLYNISLCGNDIGNQTVFKIADALEYGLPLCFIDLSSNKIGNEGIKRLADAIVSENCKQLKYLQLNFNSSITKEGYDDFANIIAEGFEKESHNCTVTIEVLDCEETDYLEETCNKKSILCGLCVRRGVKVRRSLQGSLDDN